jgi:hypothetical protein
MGNDKTLGEKVAALEADLRNLDRRIEDIDERSKEDLSTHLAWHEKNNTNVIAWVNVALVVMNLLMFAWSSFANEPSQNESARTSATVSVKNDIQSVR